MPAYTELGQPVAAPSSDSQQKTVVDLRGLDLVSPVDLMGPRTPYSKNFRLYAQKSDDRQVAVSSRKGPGYHTTPIGETKTHSNESTTNQSTAEVGVINGVHATPFTSQVNGRLTRVDIEVANTNLGAGPLLVQIYNDQDGFPTRLLTESSISGGSIGESLAFQEARFINAINLTFGEKYWIVTRIQDDGENTYSLGVSDSSDPSHSTDSALAAGEEQSYGVRYKVYTAADARDKGSYRFTRDNGDNISVVVYEDTMYKIDEATGQHIPIITDLSMSSDEYAFANGDNKLFWVNGYDWLTAWDGSEEGSHPNIVTNPSFDVNLGNWTAGTGTTMSRLTSDFNTSPASMQLTRSSGVRSAHQNITMEKGKRYKVSWWAKGLSATGFTQFAINGNGEAEQESVEAITTSWQKYELYYAPEVNVTQVAFQGSSDNIVIDDISIAETGFEYIRDDNLPILSDLIMHKDRLWGIDANDPNKLVFSENPGNPAYDPTGVTPTTSREQWYYAWLSVSFIYVPRPHNGSPVTKLVSFQDALTVFTQDNKYVISGYDRGSFNLRQSTGNKGALSRRNVTYDENRIYFVSTDGFYEHNGSADAKISELINPLYDACPRPRDATPVIWKNEVRFYMPSEASAYNDICAIYNKDLKEWQLDTDVHVNRALYYNDADDNQELVEFSSLVPASYLAEQDYNSLGAPIDFEYRLAYDSMGVPMQRKRIRTFYPILQAVESTFTIDIAMDKNFQDSPRTRNQILTVNGSMLGDFNFGDGTLLGGDTVLQKHKQNFSGYAEYWQLRVSRKGVNNRVAFSGANFSYKTKRL